MSLALLKHKQNRDFYVDVIGAELGGTLPVGLDINLFGNQITVHQSR